MKRTLTLIFFTFLAFQLSAQSGLNNLGFENWTQNSLSSKDQPDGFVAFGQSKNSADPYEPSLALKLTTDTVDYSTGGFTFKDTIGVAVIGEFDLFAQELNVGTPYPDSLPGCPDSLVGYLRHSLPNQDTATILSQVKNASGDTIATAKGHYGDTVSNWTKITVKFDPVDCGGGTADSIGLLFASETVGYDQYVQGVENRGTQTIGGQFEVDAVRLFDGSKSVSIGELAVDENASKEFSLMPNPAQDKLRFKYGSLEERVRIYDMTGRNVRNVQLGNGNSEQVSVSGMDEGLYIYRVEGKNGQRLHSGKLQVIH